MNTKSTSTGYKANNILFSLVQNSNSNIIYISVVVVVILSLTAHSINSSKMLTSKRLKYHRIYLFLFEHTHSHINYRKCCPFSFDFCFPSIFVFISIAAHAWSLNAYRYSFYFFRFEVLCETYISICVSECDLHTYSKHYKLLVFWQNAYTIPFKWFHFICSSFIAITIKREYATRCLCIHYTIQSGNDSWLNDKILIYDYLGFSRNKAISCLAIFHNAF